MSIDNAQILHIVASYGSSTSSDFSIAMRAALGNKFGGRNYSLTDNKSSTWQK